MSEDTAMLSGGDVNLLRQATDLLAARYVPGQHAVVAALRSASGTVHLGLHLGANVARASICAEAVALGVATMARDPALTRGVVVHHHQDSPGWKIVSPCGSCRELLADFAPGMRILLRDVAGGLRGALIEDLIPDKFTRD